MKKYFFIAFVLMVILLLVLRKQTEPLKFSQVAATPVPAPAPSATQISVPTPTPALSATPAGVDALAPNPEEIERLRQQARTTMVAVYAAQQAARAQWDRYTSDLVYTGWEPPGVEVNFKMGFLQAFDAPLFADGLEHPERFTTDAFLEREIQGAEKPHYTPAAAKINLNDYALYCERGCIASSDWFEMLLVVPLDDQGRVDVWTINHQKEMKLVVDGSRP